MTDARDPLADVLHPYDLVRRCGAVAWPLRLPGYGQGQITLRALIPAVERAAQEGRT